MSAAKWEPANDDDWLVYTIRLLWSADIRDEFNPSPWDYPFGAMGEDLTFEEANANLLRIFNEERPHHDSDIETIWVMIRG